MESESIIDKIQSLTDAYEILNLTRAEIVVPSPQNAYQIKANGFIDAIVLIEALNEGRKPDYTNAFEERYLIDWNMRPVTYNRSDFSFKTLMMEIDSHSDVGVNLVFFDRKVAEYAATKFWHVFESFMK